MNRLFVKILAVSVIVLLLVFMMFRKRSPFGSSNTSFATDSEKEITRIELSAGKQKLLLEKRGEKWILNGKAETRKSGILFIIRIIKEMKIKSPVSSELFDKEISEKGIEPVKVRIYEKRKLLKAFIVYKTQSNSFGNIMKMRPGSKPFIVYVPGNEGDIGSAFTLNELFWQPFTLFNYLPSEIASVNFENISDTSDSFSINTINHKYSLTGGNRNLADWDSSLVARYLTYFTRVPFESWAMDLSESEQEKIESGQPLFRITVNSMDGKKKVLTLWERMTDDAKKTDTDRLIGKTTENEELFILRYYDIDPLIKKRSYFFPR